MTLRGAAGRYQLSRYAAASLSLLSASMVTPGTLIRAHCPFVRAWAGERRGGGDTPSIALDEVIYVGMEELTEEERWL